MATLTEIDAEIAALQRKRLKLIEEKQHEATARAGANMKRWFEIRERLTGEEQSAIANAMHHMAIQYREDAKTQLAEGNKRLADGFTKQAEIAEHVRFHVEL